MSICTFTSLYFRGSVEILLLVGIIKPGKGNTNTVAVTKEQVEFHSLDL
jgi:hypothetical protein